MPDISYNLNIPAVGDVPVQDVIKMQTNTNSINTWTAVDHHAFGDTPAGQHKQVTFSEENAPVGTPTDPLSILYTGAGTASTVADLQFKNHNGTFLISGLRAMGAFTTVLAGGAVTAAMQFNVSSINFDSVSKQYTISFTANALTGSTVIVFAMSNSSTIVVSSWSYSPGSLVLTMSAGTAGIKVSFQVYQV